MAYLFPYLQGQVGWPHAPDVMYFDQWPVRHPSLLFGGLALERGALPGPVAALGGPPTVEEVIRNLPIRHPLLWVPAAKWK